MADEHCKAIKIPPNKTHPIQQTHQTLQTPEGLKNASVITIEERHIYNPTELTQKGLGKRFPEINEKGEKINAWNKEE